LNSRIPLPTERPIAGSFLGPTTRAMTRTTSSLSASLGPQLLWEMRRLQADRVMVAAVCDVDLSVRAIGVLPPPRRVFRRAGVRSGVWGVEKAREVRASFARSIGMSRAFGLAVIGRADGGRTDVEALGLADMLDEHRTATSKNEASRASAEAVALRAGGVPLSPAPRRRKFKRCKRRGPI
jgi:hypothetical protein